MRHADFISSFEAGELDRDEVVAGFQAMIDDGTVWHLQGFYHRTAMDLLQAGHCKWPDPPVITPA